MFKDIAELIYYTVVDGVPTEQSLEVFVNKKSVYGSEFYTSYQSGINTTCIFELRSEDYELTRTIEEGTNKALYATRIRYEGALYDIVRPYIKNGMVELTCS